MAEETWKDKFFRIRRRIDEALTPADKPAPEPESTPEPDDFGSIGAPGGTVESMPWDEAERLRRKRAVIRQHLGGGSPKETVEQARRRREIQRKLEGK